MITATLQRVSQCNRWTQDETSRYTFSGYRPQVNCFALRQLAFAPSLLRDTLSITTIYFILRLCIFMSCHLGHRVHVLHFQVLHIWRPPLLIAPTHRGITRLNGRIVAWMNTWITYMPQVVTNPSANCDRCRLTLLIWPTPLPFRQISHHAAA